MLDLGLPRLDGVEVCRRLRAESDVPILILTARTETEDRVEGLDTGADDYLPKPFERKELLARIRALLRRRPPRGSASLVVGDLLLNPDTREVKRGEREIELTNREFELLEYLMRNQRLVVSRERLLEEVWGYDPLRADEHDRRLHLQPAPQARGGRRAAPPAHQARRRLRAEGRRVSWIRSPKLPLFERMAGALADRDHLRRADAADPGLLRAGPRQVVGNRIRSDFREELRSAARSLAAETQRRPPIPSTARSSSTAPTSSAFALPEDAADQGRSISTGSPLAGDQPRRRPRRPERRASTTSASLSVATEPITATGSLPAYVQYARPDAGVDDTVAPALALPRRRRARRHPARPARRARGRRPRDAPDLGADRPGARDQPAPATPPSASRCPETDDEVGELARTLDGMLQALDEARSEREQSLERQREFVADASHELRTPLTSILANLELLQAAGVGSEDDRQAVDSALSSTKRMSGLVSDLLLLARADAGRRVGDARTSTWPRSPPARSRRSSRSPATAGSRAISTGPLPLEGNPDELHRLVLNLLENAVRHTPEQIDRRAHRPPRRRRGAARGRSTTAPGIPAEMEDQVFDRFVRGDGPGRHRRRRRQRPRPRDRPRRRGVARRLGRGRQEHLRRRPLLGPPAARAGPSGRQGRRAAPPSRFSKRSRTRS